MNQQKTSVLLISIAAIFVVQPVEAKDINNTYNQTNGSITTKKQLLKSTINDQGSPTEVMICCKREQSTRLPQITFTIQMDKSSLETPGTDYTMQNSVGVLGSISAAAISGAIAQVIGYQGVFAVSLVIAFLSVVLVAKTFNHIECPERLL